MILEDSVWLNILDRVHHQGQCKFEGVSWKARASEVGVLAFQSPLASRVARC